MSQPPITIMGRLVIPTDTTRIDLVTPLSRYDFATVELGDHDRLIIRRVPLEELPIFAGWLFQADSHEEIEGVILREVELFLWPFSDNEDDEAYDYESNVGMVAASSPLGVTVVNTLRWREFYRDQMDG